MAEYVGGEDQQLFFFFLPGANRHRKEENVSAIMSFTFIVATFAQFYKT